MNSAERPSRDYDNGRQTSGYQRGNRYNYPSRNYAQSNRDRRDYGPNYRRDYGLNYRGDYGPNYRGDYGSDYRRVEGYRREGTDRRFNDRQFSIYIGQTPQGAEMTGTDRMITAGTIMDTAQTETDQQITSNLKTIRAI